MTAQAIAILLALLAPGGIAAVLGGRWLDSRQAIRTRAIHADVAARVGQPNGRGNLTVMVERIDQRTERSDARLADLGGRLTRVEHQQGSCAHELALLADRLASVEEHTSALRTSSAEVDTRLAIIEHVQAGAAEADELGRQGRLLRRATDPPSVDG